MIIRGLQTFSGQHCETTATGTLLLHQGIQLSEPLLFGLGEGLSYIHWKSRDMKMPFLGGRVKPDALTRNLCRNLGISLQAKETTSTIKAWEAVKELLDQGQPVGLKLDSYYLEYFSKPIHFAGHYVAIYGYDEHFAFLVDTQQQGGLVQTSLESLAKARAARGPMASRHLYYTLNVANPLVTLRQALLTAIRNNAEAYLQPPIQNISFKGIQKTAATLASWFKSNPDAPEEFRFTAMMMEKAGMGGALFRNLYRDFLKESAVLLDSADIAAVHLEFEEIAAAWTAVANLFQKAADEQDITVVKMAAAKMNELSVQEFRAMGHLQAFAAGLSPGS